MNDSSESRQGAAPAKADAESGNAGDSRRRALFALDAMLKRGLISPEDYATRKKAIAAENP